MRWLMVALTSLGTALVAPRVEACGGFFCSQQPVEQSAERILFVVNEQQNTVSVVVEITYSGAPQNFSWVVPVPEAPALETAPRQLLRILDFATRPQFTFPRSTCRGFDDTVSSGPSFGCASADKMSGEASPAPEFAPDADEQVHVENLPRVGPYESVVVSSTDANALRDWLNTNGYIITVEMEPFINTYVQNGLKFLAMKLAPDASTSDIEPIQMTYPSTLPAIPLVLTAVASEPELGVMVFIVGNEQYEALNWQNIAIDTDRLQVRFATQTNYRALVSAQVDEAGGNAFITELAADAGDVAGSAQQFWNMDGGESQTYLNNVMPFGRRLTRLFTRVSGWEIEQDPTFWAVGQFNFNGRLDISRRPAISQCGGGGIDPVCGNLYCGVGAECASTALGDGCRCDAGQVGRLLSDGTVFCQESYFDLTASAQNQLANPCAFFSCGAAGTCVPLNGVATCQCEADHAVVAVGTQLRCEPALAVFDVTQLAVPLNAAGPGLDEATDRGCDCGLVGRQPILAVMLLAAIGRAWRRRKPLRENSAG